MPNNLRSPVYFILSLRVPVPATLLLKLGYSLVSLTDGGLYVFLGFGRSLGALYSPRTYAT